MDSKCQDQRSNIKEIEIKLSYVILIYDGLDELKIRRSSNGPKLTIVSSAFVMSSSSSDHMSKFRQVRHEV